MQTLVWIQNWFKTHCDGEWEHGHGIQITTLGTPGWEVEVDISKTSVANMRLKQILNEKSKHDWYSVEIKNQRFTASGDLGKLEFLLGLFKEMIEKIENT